MNKDNNLLDMFKEIQNNLKNPLLEKRIKDRYVDYNLEVLRRAIGAYIDNFDVLKNSTNDELIGKIEKNTQDFLNLTVNPYFEPYTFIRKAEFLIDKKPNYKKEKVQNELKFVNEFIEFLITKRGYDKNRIYLHDGMTKAMTHRSDITILGSDGNEIASIEFKFSDTENIEQKLKSYKKMYINGNRNGMNNFFVMYEREKGYKYFELLNKKIEELKEFPTYANILNSYIVHIDEEKDISELLEDDNEQLNAQDWDDFIKKVDFDKLKKIKKQVKDENYKEGKRIRVFLNLYKKHLKSEIHDLKDYKVILNQDTNQLYWTPEDGFRLTFYKGSQSSTSIQLNITFWANWGGGIFIKDKERKIYSNKELLKKIKDQYSDLIFEDEKSVIIALKFNKGIANEEEVINAVKVLLDVLSRADSEKIIKAKNNVVVPQHIKIGKKSDIKPVFGVRLIAEILSKVIMNQPDESGMMIGIFGKWGRGKTFFADKTWDFIKKEKPKYRRVDFSAWKYQDTKESWAYLYEVFMKKYLLDVTFEVSLDFIKNKKVLYHLKGNENQKYLSAVQWNNKIEKLEDIINSYKIIKNIRNSNFYKLFKLNLKKSGWISILLFIIGAILFFTIGKMSIIKFLISLFGIAVFLKIVTFYFLQKTTAMGLYKQYFSKTDFNNYLGLQAEIERELSILLQTWIPNDKVWSTTKKQDEKIVLFVDDIDRCNIDQVIDIVDGLRVILDNPVIYERVIIITAIDEKILGEALKHKYSEIKDDMIGKLYKEYLEKIFIIGIKLNDLNETEIEDFLDKLLPKYEQKSEKILVQAGETRWKNRETNSKSLELETTPSKYRTANKMVKSQTEENNQKNSKQSKDEEFKKYEMSDYELSAAEREYLISKIKNLENPTPRRMRIFYYKYLIMKQLFHIKLEENELLELWNTEEDEKIIVDVLIHFSNVVDDESYSSGKSESIDKELIYVAKMVSVF